MEEIRSLAAIMREAELTCLEVTEGESKIRLERRPPVVRNIMTAPQGENNLSQSVPAAVQAQPSGKQEESGLREVRSPMVGVFYASPSPDAEPFVKVGSHVKKGDVLCVIEAMKLLNELNSDMDGEIAEICAGNGQVVEYGQPLFKIR